MLPRNCIRIALATLVGCAASASYLYAPQDASYWSDGYPAATNPVPPELPQGRVDVTSFGIVEIKPDGFSPMNVLHVRLAVTNEADAMAWTLAPGEQLVEIAGEGRSRPIYVNTDVSSLPMISIAQRERRLLDFYFPLPASIDSDEDLPAFDVLRLAVPADVSEIEVAQTITGATKKKRGKLHGNVLASKVRVERLSVQRVGRALHVGPYGLEGKTLKAIDTKLAATRLAPARSHVEVYLKDPRRTPPGRLETVLLRELA
jgi:hypothetical protein